MKRFLQSFAVAVALLGSGARAPARADEATLRAAFTEIYGKVDVALKTKDLKAIQALEADDYVSVAEDGSITKRAEADALSVQALAQIQSIETYVTRFDLLKNSDNDPRTTVETSVSLAATIIGEDGKAHKVHGLQRSRDTWTPQNGEWRLQRTQALGGTMSVDDPAH